MTLSPVYLELLFFCETKYQNTKIIYHVDHVIMPFIYTLATFIRISFFLLGEPFPFRYILLWNPIFNHFFRWHYCYFCCIASWVFFRCLFLGKSHHRIYVYHLMVPYIILCKRARYNKIHSYWWTYSTLYLISMFLHFTSNLVYRWRSPVLFAVSNFWFMCSLANTLDSIQIRTHRFRCV